MKFVWQAEDSAAVAGICPVCDHQGPHSPVVIIPESGVGGADWLVVECPGCATRFSTDRRGADYSAEAKPGGPLLDFYLEQGAGVRPMLEPLGWAQPAEGKRLLEIGGGFGFASDFAQVALGWTAKGYDPSGLAALGREYLGLDIVLDYWTTDVPLSEPYHVAYASEVIEHIPEPSGFLGAIKRAVGETGVAVLTTPNGAALNPGTTPGMLAPIASPGLHLTLFSARGLEHALRRAGFAEVRVEEHGASLYAFASDSLLPASTPLDDRLYRSYLLKRMATPGLAPALLSGLRYRLYKEMVNTGESTAALALYNEMAEAVQARFGIDLHRPETLLPPEQLVDIDEWLGLFPGNLTGLLYFRAVLANNVEADARKAALYSAAAALMGASLRAAIQRVGMEDGESELLTAAAIRLLLSASVGADVDMAPLLGALERGNAGQGLLIPERDRLLLRKGLARDLRATRHPHILWRAIMPVETTAPEEVLLRAALVAGMPAISASPFQAIETAEDSDSVKAALREIWITPGAPEAVATIRHARKLTLIRLVLLGAFAEAEELFAAWESPDLADDEPVATALGIAASARGA